MVSARSRLLVVALALVIGACSDELRGPPARDVAVAAERALATFEAPADTRALLDRATTAAWSLDARTLHQSIPGDGRVDGTHGVWFDIGGAKEHRSIDHRPVGAASTPRQIFDPSVYVPHEGEPELGRYSLLLASMPLTSGDYRLRVTSAIGSGRGDLLTLWRAVPDALRYLERGASVAEVRRSFPRTSEFAARYGEFRVTTEPALPSGAAIDIRLRANRNAVAAQYPHLVRYVERISRRVRTSGALECEDGMEIASWSFRGPEEGVRLAFVTSDGRLQPRTGEPVDLTSPQHLRLVQSSSAELFGVKSSIEGLRSDVESDPRSSAARIEFHAHRDPETVKVEGALFGVVPVAAIDAVMPGTLEGSVRSILATLLHGRDGEGVEVLVRSRVVSGDDHEISSTFVADVPATRFARRALALATALIQADASERADMLRFARDLAACLAADLA